jgi:hypothetical protein
MVFSQVSRFEKSCSAQETSRVWKKCSARLRFSLPQVTPGSASDSAEGWALFPTEPRLSLRLRLSLKVPQLYGISRRGLERKAVAIH